MFEGESGRLYLVMTPSSIVGQSYTYDALTGELLADNNVLDQLDGIAPTLPEPNPWVREVPLEEWPASTTKSVGGAALEAACYVSVLGADGRWEELWLGKDCEIVERT